MSQKVESIADISRRMQEQLDRAAAEYAQKPKCPVCGEVMDGQECWSCKERAERAHQEQERQRAVDIKRLGGLKAYERFTLDTYENKEAIEACTGYPNCNLYLWGAAGVGKTHLATAIVRGCLRAVVVKPAQIFRKLRGIKSGAEEQAMIDRIAAIPQLVIDDLGVEKRTEFSMASLYEIIDARDMNYTKGLIVTSNLSMGALSERLGDDRITSRLAGMCKVVEITGKDRRIYRPAAASNQEGA